MRNTNNKPLLEKMFDKDEYNALMSAFWDLAGSKDGIYTYLEETPKSSLVAEVVDKLKEFGYVIQCVDTNSIQLEEKIKELGEIKGIHMLQEDGKAVTDLVDRKQVIKILRK